MMLVCLHLKYSKICCNNLCYQNALLIIKQQELYASKLNKLQQVQIIRIRINI